jgi:hypothetical protein
MKKLFIVVITEVAGSLDGPIVYYIRATDYFAAEEFAREIMLENGFADEDIDDQFDFDIREFREDEVLEA